MVLETFILPLAVQGPMAALLDEAARSGAALGRDHDWTPPHVDEALFELLLAGSPRVRYADPHEAAYPFRIVLHIDHDRFVEKAHEYGFRDPRGLKASLVAALGSSESPADMHFEIVDIADVTSAHNVLARRALLESLLI